MIDDEEEIKEVFWERVREVSEIMRRRPHNAIEALEALGFTYVVEDGEDEADIAEERAAMPQNTAERNLVEYLDGDAPPDETMLALWRDVTEAEEPNYPLYRRYFRAGNARLKALLLFGLEHNPADRELLSDLSFFHLFSPMLKELIALYSRACDAEDDPDRFTVLAGDFDDFTYDSGYEALLALQERYPSGSEKAVLVQKLFAEREKLEAQMEPRNFNVLQDQET